MYLSIGQAAETIGVSISTLRRWDKNNYFKPDYLTKGRHRRYSIARINEKFIDIVDVNGSSESDRIACAYARVSSADQKLDLKRQEKRLENYCKKNHPKYEIISDLGSGTKIISSSVSHLILTHKDRLLRFGSPLLFKLCEYFGTKVIILDETKQKTFEEELVGDVIEILTVFTAKLYGRRSHKNKVAC